jgi:aminomethyltransferase
MLKLTPVYPRVAELCKSRKWQSWEGYLMADSYDFSSESEYYAIRNTVALFDFYALYVYRITGVDAEKLLNYLVTRDISKCKIGQAMYTAWCNADGKLVDDGMVFRFPDGVYQLTSNTPNLDWLHKIVSELGLNVTIEDISTDTMTLPIQGPKSRDVLNKIADVNLDDLKYFYFVSTKIKDVPVVISRTGYTGDLGYEVWTDKANALTMWDILMEAGASAGINPAGFCALDMVRIEAGLIWYEYDYMPANLATSEAEMSSPFEVSLGWTVNLKKQNFLGREALLAEQEKGVKRQLVGLELDGDFLKNTYGFEKLPMLQDLSTPWRTKKAIYVGDRNIGYATSGCWLPVLKKHVAIACIDSSYTEIGTDVMLEISIGNQRQLLPARVTTFPFFDPTRKKDTVS